MTAAIPRLRSQARFAAEEYALSAIAAPGRPGPRRAMRTWSGSGMNCG
jgi:hypothetical protein